MGRTPYDRDTVNQLVYSTSPVNAVVRAWMVPGPDPYWHNAQKDALREMMPVLAVALDRLTQETGESWRE